MLRGKGNLIFDSPAAVAAAGIDLAGQWSGTAKQDLGLWQARVMIETNDGS
ncbi:MAG: hypothetical protein LAP21_22615 [Acidobacteriia bacterium]|nr:hypothetical protein [Terriglobia bacterium]